LNYKLLDHEELHRVRDNNAVKKAYELSEINGIDVPNPSNLNLSTGVAKTMMDKIVDCKIQEKALDTACKDQEEEFISRQQEIFNNCSKMTAGVAFNAGNLCLNGKIREKVREQHNNRQQKLADSEKKRKDEHIKLLSKVDAIGQKIAILQSGMRVTYKQWSPGSKDQETASFRKARTSFYDHTYSPAIALNRNAIV
jgi:hypothetical protein